MRRLSAVLGTLVALSVSVGIAAAPASAAPAFCGANETGFLVYHGAGVWFGPSNTTRGVGLVNAGDVVCVDYATGGQTLTFYDPPVTTNVWYHVPAKNNGYLWAGATNRPGS